MPDQIDRFIRAAEKGDIPTLRACLQAGIDINEKAGWRAAPALHYAICKKQMAAVEFLLSQPGISLDYRDRWGWSCIQWAVFTSTPDIVHLLLGAGGQFAQVHFQYAYEGALAQLQALPSLDSLLVDNLGCGLLHYAAANGQLETAKWLLAHNARPNARDNGGNTALLSAASNGHLDTVKWLLAHKARPNARDNGGNNALLCAASNGHLDTIKWLLAHRANPYARNNGGNTALLCAAYNGHLDTVEWLLAHNARPYARNNGGNTALLCAAYNGHLDTVKWLLAHNAWLGAQDNGGKNALLHAAAQGHVSIVQWLLVTYPVNLGRPLPVTDVSSFFTFVSRMAYEQYDPTMRLSRNDNRGNTALLLAAANGQLGTVKLLLENGANLTKKNHRGHTALLLAAGNGQLDTVKLLLENGANLTEKDRFGNTNTALLLAAANGQLDTVKLLLENGASLTEKDRYGNTALLLAAINGHSGTVKWLLENDAPFDKQTKQRMESRHSQLLSVIRQPYVKQVLSLLNSRPIQAPMGQGALQAIDFIVRWRREGLLEGLLKANSNKLVLLDALYNAIAKRFENDVSYANHDTISQLIVYAQLASTKTQYLAILNSYFHYLNKSAILTTTNHLGLFNLLRLANRGTVCWLTAEELAGAFRQKRYRKMLLPIAEATINAEKLADYLMLWMDVLTSFYDSGVVLDLQKDSKWVEQALTSLETALNKLNKHEQKPLRPLLTFAQQTAKQLEVLHRGKHARSAFNYILASIGNVGQIVTTVGFIVNGNPFAIGGLFSPITNLGKQIGFSLLEAKKLLGDCLKKKSWCERAHAYRQLIKGQVLSYLLTIYNPESIDTDSTDWLDEIKDSLKAWLGQSGFKDHAAVCYTTTTLLDEVIRACYHLTIPGIDELVNVLFQDGLMAYFRVVGEEDNNNIIEVALFYDKHFRQTNHADTSTNNSAAQLTTDVAVKPWAVKNDLTLLRSAYDKFKKHNSPGWEKFGFPSELSKPGVKSDTPAVQDTRDSIQSNSHQQPISPAPNTDPHSASYTPIIRLTPVMQQRNVLGNFTAEELSELHSTSGDTPSYGN